MCLIYVDPGKYEVSDLGGFLVMGLIRPFLCPEMHVSRGLSSWEGMHQKDYPRPGSLVKCAVPVSGHVHVELGEC